MISDDPLRIEWEDQSDNEEGFRIWAKRSSDQVCSGGTWELIAQAEANVTVHSFGSSICAVRDGLSGSGEYLCVRIEAFRGGESVFSGAVNLIDDPQLCSPPTAPADLGVALNPCLIHWYDTSDNEERFHIYVKKSSNGCESAPGDVWLRLATVGPDVTNYNLGVTLCEDLSIPALGEIGFGEKVCVRVAANNSYGESSSDPIILYEKSTPQAYVTHASYSVTLVCNTLRDHLERIQGTANYGIASSDPTVPESVSLSEDTQDGAFTAEASTFNGAQPKARVSGSARDVNGRAYALLAFDFQLIPIRADAPTDFEVPIICRVQGQTSADRVGDVRTEVELTLNAGGEENRTQIQACPESNPQMCPYIGWADSLDEEYTFTMGLSTNNYGSLVMQARFFCGYSSSRGTGSGWAEMVVNSIEIDPLAQVGGVPANQLYRLVFSEGVLGS